MLQNVYIPPPKGGFAAWLLTAASSSDLALSEERNPPSFGVF